MKLYTKYVVIRTVHRNIDNLGSLKLKTLVRNTRDLGSSPGRSNIFRNKFIYNFSVYIFLIG